MKVFIQDKNKEFSISFSGSIKDLLKELDINPQSVFIVKNDQIAGLDEDVGSSDHIKVLEVFMGG